MTGVQITPTSPQTFAFDDTDYDVRADHQPREYPSLKSLIKKGLLKMSNNNDTMNDNDNDNKMEKNKTSIDLSEIFPIFKWLPFYNLDWLKRDVIAGITVAILLVPQTLAYANIAGVPEVWGLYSSITPLFMYVIWSTSAQMSIGPGAACSIMTASAIEGILTGSEHLSREEYQQQYNALAICVSLLTGVIQISLGYFRFGGILKYLTKPVMVGFITCAAMYIVTSQIKNVLGLSIGRYPYLYQSMSEILLNLVSTNIYTLALAITSFVVLIIPTKCPNIIPKWMKICLPLVWVCFSAFLSMSFDFESNFNIDIVGAEVNAGLPKANFPSLGLIVNNLHTLFPASLILAIVSYMGSYACAKSIEQRVHETHRVVTKKYEQQQIKQQLKFKLKLNKNQPEEAEAEEEEIIIAVVHGVDDQNDEQEEENDEKKIEKPIPRANLNIDANGEFIAFGMSNMFGSMFSAMPIAGSFSRTALNTDMEVFTPISILVQATFALCSILLFMPFLSFLPKCVLGALVMTCTRRLFNNGIREFEFLWNVSRIELIEYSVSIIMPLVFGLELGILLAMLTSICVNFYLQNIKTEVVELGYICARNNNNNNNNHSNTNNNFNVKPGKKSPVHYHMQNNNIISIANHIEFVDINYYKNAQTISNRIIVLELRAQLSFTNCTQLIKYLNENNANQTCTHVIISMVHTQCIDSTALRQLSDSLNECKQITVVFSQCRAPVQAMITRFSANNDFNIKSFVSTLDAVIYCQSELDPQEECDMFLAVSPSPRAIDSCESGNERMSINIEHIR